MTKHAHSKRKQFHESICYPYNLLTVDLYFLPSIDGNGTPSATRFAHSGGTSTVTHSIGERDAPFCYLILSLAHFSRFQHSFTLRFLSLLSTLYLISFHELTGRTCNNFMENPK